jgi:hypothetical protein
MEEKAERLLKRYEALDSRKGTLKSHIQEIAEYMLPSMASITQVQTEGGKRMTNVFDGTAIRALDIWTNGLYSHLTSPASPWFSLTTKNKELAQMWDVSQWLSDTSRRMMDGINSSNFGMAIQEVYRQIGAFGSVALYLEPGVRHVLNFKTYDIGRVCIDENSEGLVDTVMRLEEFTARQCDQNWGNRISETIKKSLEKQDSIEKFKILHAVLPRGEVKQGSRDRENMPIASLYIEQETGNILDEGGYKEMPYMVPRMKRDSKELYGRSQGMDALPDVKMVNKMAYSSIVAYEKMGNPPILAPDEMRMSPLRTKPGGVSYYTGQKPPEYWNQPTTINLALEYEGERKKAIYETFFADLFLLLANAPKGMTATEVMQRAEERLMLLGPALGALQPELFNPMLERVFWIMYRGGFIGPPPDALVDEGLDIEYTSKLAMAMRAFETQAMAQTVGMVGPWLQIEPQVIDNFDLDSASRGIAERNGVPADWLRSEDAVKKVRGQRAQAQADAEKKQQELIETEQLIKGAPALQKAPEQGSIAEAMGMGGAGQGNA